MITKQKEWDECVAKNQDPYGKACIDVAREVMRLLDEPIYQDGNIDCHKLICDADDNVKASGITGYMDGCVAQMVGAFHSRGEDFRKSWNKGYGVDEEKAKGGIVNPAILTIKD
jgi:hypothetical protein